MTARPIRYQRQVSDRNGKIFYTSIASLSHISKWQGTVFKTASGLPFTYTIHKGKRGQLTKELWIDRREGSKSLSFGSIRMAFQNACREKYSPRPKAMGDIRGVSYMYPIFWKLGIIEVPLKYAEKMKDEEI